MSSQRRPRAPYLPGDKDRFVLADEPRNAEPTYELLWIALPSDLWARIDSWRRGGGLSMSEAIARLSEAGLDQLSQKPTRRGPKDVWADGRRLQLLAQVSMIRTELQAGRKKRRVSVPKAIDALRKQRPGLWGKYTTDSLVTRFYEAQRVFEERRLDYGPEFKEKHEEVAQAGRNNPVPIDIPPMIATALDHAQFLRSSGDEVGYRAAMREIEETLAPDQVALMRRRKIL